MTDETNPTPGAGPTPPDDPKTWAPGGDPADNGEGPSSRSREWLSQLQEMIDRVAAEAGPVARDVAAKAAELAAVAGEKAGPFARRAADVTGDVGTMVAERSRRFADEMRHHGAEGGAPPDAPVDGAPPEDAPPVDAPPA